MRMESRMTVRAGTWKNSQRRRRIVRSSLLGIVALLLLAVVPGRSVAEPVAKLPAGQDYGAGITLADLSDFEDVLSQPEKYAGSPVLIRGRISDVCQRKGCWTVLSQGEEQVRVRFLDYAFFLPKDCSGKQAYVEGIVAVETLSVKMARHYASESQQEASESQQEASESQQEASESQQDASDSSSDDPSAIHGPRQVVGFTASGVRIVDAD
jgi:hypothetical protein